MYSVRDEDSCHSMCGPPGAPAPFVEETVFATAHILAPMSKLPSAAVWVSLGPVLWCIDLYARFVMGSCWICHSDCIIPSGFQIHPLRTVSSFMFYFEILLFYNKYPNKDLAFRDNVSSLACTLETFREVEKAEVLGTWQRCQVCTGLEFL